MSAHEMNPQTRAIIEPLKKAVDEAKARLQLAARVVLAVDGVAVEPDQHITITTHSLSVLQPMLEDPPSVVQRAGERK